MVYIYDIETYFNYFGVQFKNVNTQEIHEFIIFEKRNDFNALIDFISDQNKWLIGYNSFSFDNQLLNFMYKKQFGLSRDTSDQICEQIYNVAKDIITDRNFAGYKYNLPFKYIDLMKLSGSYKSLKLTGVNLKWHKLQDLPIPWETLITENDLEVMHSYNLNDVLITEQLYYKLLPEIKMRFQISKEYNVDAYSESRSGLSNRLLEKFYSESTGLEINEFKELRTKRAMIPFSSVIFDDISFKTPELNKLLEKMYEYTFFTSKPFFKKHIIFDGVKYQLGIGGIHSLDTGAVFESTSKYNLIDADISSMYPSTVINNNIHPAHLGSAFIRKYKELRDTRLIAKHSGNKVVAEALKITLNSSWGKFLFDKHWLYDPLAGLRTTINGQLYLLMLIEKLVLNNFKVISANTDGIVTIVPINRESEYKLLCKEWEKETNYELEFTYYKKYIRRDVNNYVSIKSDGDIKLKGIFQYDPGKINPNTGGLTSGFDKPIISRALYEYFVNNKKIEDTIRGHRDIYDFCIAQKSDDKFTNVYHYLKDNEKVIEKLQKTVRFYISTDGGKLFKQDDTGKMIEYCVGKRITIFNNYIGKGSHDAKVSRQPLDAYNIDYSYYIAEAYKILYSIENPQLTLF